ncbi:MAG: hypothetical protein Pars93KO_27600 [Parasphingorhabdus sp.]
MPNYLVTIDGHGVVGKSWEHTLLNGDSTGVSGAYRFESTPTVSSDKVEGSYNAPQGQTRHATFNLAMPEDTTLTYLRYRIEGHYDVGQTHSNGGGNWIIDGNSSTFLHATSGIGQEVTLDIVATGSFAVTPSTPIVGANLQGTGSYGDASGVWDVTEIELRGLGENPFGGDAETILGDAFFKMPPNSEPVAWGGAGGLQFNGANVELSNVSPSAYNPSHHYEFIATGTDSPWTFNFVDTDGDYSLNSGSLTCKIRELTT